MATQPWSWESKRWTALASFLVLVSLYGTLWYLFGGCEPGPKTPADTAAPADPTIKVLQAMSDSNVSELAFQIAWFHARHGRLPADIDEVHRDGSVPGWPPAPTATSRGQALTYRPTGGRTYELILAAKDGATGTADDLRLMLEVPANLPADLTPEALRTWWDLEHVRRMIQEMQKRLNRSR